MIALSKPLRLSKEEIKTLKNAIYEQDRDALVYLFGSRVNSQKRGGNIDILILSDKLTQRDIRTVRITFFQHFDEQKLDILLDSKNPNKVFTHTILSQAVLL